MVKRIFFIFALVCCFSVFGFSDDSTLSVSRLVGHAWGNHIDIREMEQVRGFGGLFVQFKSDMSFQALAGPGQGGEYTITGRYEIAGEKLNLYKRTAKGFEPWVYSGTLEYGPVEGVYPFFYVRFTNSFVTSGEKIFAPEGLHDRILIDMTTTFTRDRAITIDGHPAVVVNRPGKTTDVLNIRTSPSVRAELRTFETMDGWFSSLPKDAHVQILARTAKKDKAGNVENYWYFIKYWPDSPGWIMGWVFAEYVELE